MAAKPKHHAIERAGAIAKTMALSATEHSRRGRAVAQSDYGLASPPPDSRSQIAVPMTSNPTIEHGERSSLISLQLGSEQMSKSQFSGTAAPTPSIKTRDRVGARGQSTFAPKKLDTIVTQCN
jgi:hypothetical protein